MLPRHLLVIVLTALVSLSCYQITARSRMASIVAVAGELMTSQSLYPVEREELLKSAIEGMLENLDVHSYFLTGSAADDRVEFLNQAYAGLGIHIRREVETGHVLIVKPLFGSPAMDAGLIAGDQIVGINGQPVSEIESFDDIRGMLKGPEGSEVQLDIQRWQEDKQDWLKWSLSVPRRVIPTFTVVGDRPDDVGGWHYDLQDRPSVAYIRIKQFGSRTVEELRAALGQVDGKAEQLILDLRENGGGLLEAAIGVCDLFVDDPQRVIVTIRDRDGKVQQQYNATDSRALKTAVPMVVLVNRGSASASEIVAACLQDHGLATIVGEQTFGKGTVQTQFSLPRARTFLNLTTASYWRPDGRNIHRMRWRSESKRPAADMVDPEQETEWGVRPARAAHEMPLNMRDRAFLVAIYDRRELGLPLEDVEDRLKELEVQIAASQA